MMKVLITGSREYDDWESLFDVLDYLHSQKNFDVLIHGGARGADKLAGQWAVSRKVKILRCPADWEKYGRGAGVKRNKEMLQHGPDLLVAFPGGRGTANMTTLAMRFGIKVVKAGDVLQ